jgi:catalase
MPVGKMVLDRNRRTFSPKSTGGLLPGDLVPGIELSADMLLQGRVSLCDTQRHRLGPNYLQLPIHRPLAEVNNNQQDGAMRYSIPKDGQL